MKEFEYVGDNTMLDTRLNEKLHPCPYDGGGNGACPYWVYFDEDLFEERPAGFYCYDDMLEDCELGK